MYTDFKLSDIMSEKNVTSKELAERTGISKRTLEQYRCSRRRPTLENGLKIADALQIDPRELYGNDI